MPALKQYFVAGAVMMLFAATNAQTLPEDQYSRIELLSATSAVGNGEPVLLGIAIETRPHWKTYWRSAGEAGLPPRFTWSRVDNSTDPQLLWPAPERFAVQGIESYGYTERVIFPVRIDPIDATKKLRIQVSVDYAVCLDICVPQQANLEIELAPGQGDATASAPDINTALAKVPKVQGPGTQPRILSSKLEISGDSTMLIIDARSDRPFAAPELFIHAPGSAGEDFLFGAPRADFSGNRSEARFQVPIKALNPGRQPGGLPVTLTLVDAERAVDHNIILGR